MKLTKIFSGFFKKYCTKSGVPDGIRSRKIPNCQAGDEIIVFKTITTDDILNFAKLTGDYNPIHVDAPQKLVHGALLNGLVSGVIGTKLPGPGTIVVQQNFTFPKPCYAGDTIEIKVHILSVKKIMKCEYTCMANGERIVFKGDAKLIRTMKE